MWLLSFGDDFTDSRPRHGWKGETENMITEKIQWRSTYEQALGEARGAGKLVLVDLFNPY